MKTQNKIMGKGMIVFLLAALSLMCIAHGQVGNPEADAALEKAYAARQNMSGSGYSISMITDIIDEAVSARDAGDYARTIDLCSQAAGLASRSYDLSRRIQLLEAALGSGRSLNITADIEEMSMREAKAEFRSGNLDTTASLLDSINASIAIGSASRFDASRVRISALALEAEEAGIDPSVFQELLEQNAAAGAAGDIAALQSIGEREAALRSQFGLVKIAMGNWHAALSGGIPAVRFDDLFYETEYSMKAGRADRVRNLSLESSQLMDEAIIAAGRINRTGRKIALISSRGIDAAGAEEIMQDAKDAYLSSDFARAAALADKSLGIAENAEAGAMILAASSGAGRSGFRLLPYVLSHLKAIMLISLAVAALAFIFIRAQEKTLIRRRIARLKSERESIVELIKGLQREYYVDKSIPRHEYESKLGRYENRLISIARNEPLLRRRLAGSGRNRK